MFRRDIIDGNIRLGVLTFGTEAFLRLDLDERTLLGEFRINNNVNSKLLFGIND